MEAALTAVSTGREQFSQPVMDAMAEVRRENFVSAHCIPHPYDNGPL